MYHINMTLPAFPLEGRIFTMKDPKVTYTCIGYGQPPDVGMLLLIGALIDANTGRATIHTFAAKDVTFVP